MEQTHCNEINHLPEKMKLLIHLLVLEDIKLLYRESHSGYFVSIKYIHDLYIYLPSVRISSSHSVIFRGVATRGSTCRESITL